MKWLFKTLQTITALKKTYALRIVTSLIGVVDSNKKEEVMDIKSVLEDRDLNQLVYNALSFGTAVMLGAFVYFLTQIKSVAKQF